MSIILYVNIVFNQKKNHKWELNHPLGIEVKQSKEIKNNLKMYQNYRIYYSTYEQLLSK